MRGKETEFELEPPSDPNCFFGTNAFTNLILSFIPQSTLTDFNRDVSIMPSYWY